VTRYYYRPHLGAELTFVDKQSPAVHAVPGVPGLARQTSETHYQKDSGQDAQAEKGRISSPEL
jgi:hypothetical protein